VLEGFVLRFSLFFCKFQKSQKQTLIKYEVDLSMSFETLCASGRSREFQIVWYEILLCIFFALSVVGFIVGIFAS